VNQNDVWYARLHLTFEFVITAMVLAGVFVIALTPTSEAIDSGASAIAALVVGYWFGRRNQ
jgi:hypothetical protein